MHCLKLTFILGFNNHPYVCMYKIVIYKSSFLKKKKLYIFKFGRDLIWRTENYVKLGEDLIGEWSFF